MINDIIRTYKKIIIMVLLIICGIFFWFFGCARDYDTPEIVQRIERKHDPDGKTSYVFSSKRLEGTVVLGTKGYIVPGRTLPVVMKVRARESDFAGTMKVTLPGEDGKGVSYQCALLCKTDDYTTVESQVPSLGDASFFNLEVLDTYGDNEFSATISPKRSDKKDYLHKDGKIYEPLLIGLLSESYDAADKLERLELVSNENNADGTDDNRKMVHIIKLEKSDLENPDFRFDALSGIIIDDYDTSNISKKALSGIFNYVRSNGGRLMICTGANGRKVLSGINVLTGADFDRVKEQSMIISLNEATDTGLDVDMSVVKLKDDFDWIKKNSLIEIFDRNLGEGKIRVLPISLSDWRILNWTDHSELFRNCLDDFLTDADHKEKDPDAASLWYIKSTLYSFISDAVPGTSGYTFFLMIYICVLGSIAYYLIKKAKKKESIWWVIPGVSIIFTCILLLVNVGQNKPNSELSAINLVDHDNHTSEIYCLYQNAEGTASNIFMNKGVTEIAPVDYKYRADELLTAKKSLSSNYTVNNTINGYELKFNDTVPGTTFMFKVSCDRDMTLSQDNVENPTPTARIKTVLHDTETKHWGTITNASDNIYKAIVIIKGDRYAVIRRVKPWEKAEINHSSVKRWVENSESADENSDEAEDNTMSNLIDYVCQRYCDRNNKDTVISVGIRHGNKINLLKGTSTFKNSYILDENSDQIRIE